MRIIYVHLCEINLPFIDDVVMTSRDSHKCVVCSKDFQKVELK